MLRVQHRIYIQGRIQRILSPQEKNLDYGST